MSGRWRSAPGCWRTARMTRKSRCGSTPTPPGTRSASSRRSPADDSAAGAEAQVGWAGARIWESSAVLVLREEPEAGQEADRRAGRDAHICSECLALCDEILSEQLPG